jgi:hypothetical protein
VSAALAAPYVSNFGSWWARKPTNSRRLREVQASHEILQAKNQLLVERDNEKAIYEQNLIDQAKRDESVKEIEDDDLRGSVEDKIAASRSSESDEVFMPDPTRTNLDIWASLSEQARRVFEKTIGESDGKVEWDRSEYGEETFSVGGAIIASENNRKPFLGMLAALEELEKMGLMSISDRSYFVTKRGYDLSKGVELR